MSIIYPADKAEWTREHVSAMIKEVREDLREFQQEMDEKLDVLGSFVVAPAVKRVVGDLLAFLVQRPRNDASIVDVSLIDVQKAVETLTGCPIKSFYDIFSSRNVNRVQMNAQQMSALAKNALSRVKLFPHLKSRLAREVVILRNWKALSARFLHADYV